MYLLKKNSNTPSYWMPFNCYFINMSYITQNAIQSLHHHFIGEQTGKLNVFSGSQKLLSRRSNFLLELPYFFTHLFNSNIEYLPSTRSTSRYLNEENKNKAAASWVYTVGCINYTQTVLSALGKAAVGPWQ